MSEVGMAKFANRFSTTGNARCRASPTFLTPPFACPYEIRVANFNQELTKKGRVSIEQEEAEGAERPTIERDGWDRFSIAKHVVPSWVGHVAKPDDHGAHGVTRPTTGPGSTARWTILSSGMSGECLSGEWRWEKAGTRRRGPARRRQGTFLSQSAECVWGDAEDVFEGAGEMELIAEAGAFGNLLDQCAGLLEPFGGEVHF
jgi:hypothetical protein